MNGAGLFALCSGALEEQQNFFALCHPPVGSSSPLRARLLFLRRGVSFLVFPACFPRRGQVRVDTGAALEGGGSVEVWKSAEVEWDI